ncbi:MAG TPA: Ig-like domain-containing protein [Clostridium sp.]|uniref:Ig-like domain-containing protein n=1 Tax=Clostridium sp. TaxID=1506 RepID=UPI002F927D96
MRFNLNKPKVRVTITLTVIAFVVILVLTTNFIKNNVTVNKIRENIEQGSNNLALGKVNKAKECFEQAISLQKEKKETYILIKDEYLKSERLDDALSILKQGKNNKVTGLETLIEEIKQKFEVTNLEESVYQNESYTLPKKAVIKINNEDINALLKWKDALMETNKIGDLVFEGVAENYERSVKLTVHIIPKIVSIKEISVSIIKGQEYNLPLKVTTTFSDKIIREVDVKWSPNKVDSVTVGSQNFLGTIQNYEKKIKMQVIVKPKPIVKSKQIGYISMVYEEGGKKYLKFDDVKFLTGNAAIEAAKKDGDAVYENGKYFVYDDYYIVNSSKVVKSYVIADNASLNLLGCWIDLISSDINNHSVSYDNFKSVSSKREYMLCYIYTENDVVVKVEGQFTP